MSVLAPYDLPNFVIEGNDVLVNKPKVCAYRAPGGASGVASPLNGQIVAICS